MKRGTLKYKILERNKSLFLEKRDNNKRSSEKRGNLCLINIVVVEAKNSRIEIIIKATTVEASTREEIMILMREMMIKMDTVEEEEEEDKKEEEDITEEIKVAMEEEEVIDIRERKSIIVMQTKTKKMSKTIIRFVIKMRK